MGDAHARRIGMILQTHWHGGVASLDLVMRYADAFRVSKVVHVVLATPAWIIRVCRIIEWDVISKSVVNNLSYHRRTANSRTRRLNQHSLGREMVRHLLFFIQSRCVREDQVGIPNDDWVRRLDYGDGFTLHKHLLVL
jgi:hypothetical protein